MPRPKDGSTFADFNEIDAAIDAILSGDDPKRVLRDPELALERVRHGGLSTDEPAGLEQRAHEAITHSDLSDHVEEIGAVVTQPRNARESMHAERAAAREGWQRVLAALNRFMGSFVLRCPVVQDDGGAWGEGAIGTAVVENGAS